MLRPQDRMLGLVADDEELVAGALRHVAYAGGWKRLEPMWDWVIRARRLPYLLPVLETVLTGLEKRAESGKVSLQPELS